MRRLAILIAATAVLSTFPALFANAQLTPSGWNHGCFRFGEAGYRWYGFCLGPDFVYPHHKTCAVNGWCSYS